MAQDFPRKQKVVIVGAGPVGSLAALYAAARGDDVELYELRGGESTLVCYFHDIYVQCYCMLQSERISYRK
jgi:thioredoxin reductase